MNAMSLNPVTADMTRSRAVCAVPTSVARLRKRPPFGLTTRVWAFIKVFLAASLSCLAIYALAEHAIAWQPAHWDVADRLMLVTKMAAFALFPALVAVVVVAAQRLNPTYFAEGRVKPDCALDINTRFIQNTFEQFILYLVGGAALALYILPADAKTVPELAFMFFAGRVLYWWGYHRNTYMRSFGFGVTFYPTVAVYAWLALYTTTGIYVTI